MPEPDSINERVLTLEGKVDNIMKTLGAIEQKLDASSLSQKNDRRYVWGVVVSVVGLLLVPSLTGISVTMGLYINSLVAPVKQDVTAAQSRLDGLLRVQDMNVNRGVSTEKDLATEVATRRSQIVEVETQFHALSESTNAALAELHRWNSQAAEKIPGMPKYPSGPFVFPNISNRHRTDN